MSGDEQVMVPMMHQQHRFRYGESSTVRMLELPYAGYECFSMLILLPRKIDGLSDLEKVLTSEKLQKWPAGLKSQLVNVHLPKFKMTSEFELRDVLSSMGMSLAFSNKVDFSSMSTQEQLLISAVIHKAFVDVSWGGPGPTIELHPTGLEPVTFGSVVHR